jgi:EmrB/QacA subfamily drug resistance transporter
MLSRRDNNVITTFHDRRHTAMDTLSATATDPPRQTAAGRRRWLILAVLCASVLVVVLDGTIVNVALPTLATQLGASTSQLQWIVDAYVLVFAGLLMAAGSFGDRVGRKWVLMGGLGLFAAFSALGATSGSADTLIAWRAAMGVGAALMFPATLAILVNVFTVAKERAVAIAVWAATAGLAVALGPVTGGWLLEHFWWGSVLMINVPVVAVALVLIAVFVPNSKDTTIERFDPLGTFLSIAAIVTLVWAVIEGPVHGWASSTSIAAFALAAVLLAGFIAWERHTDHPMLDVSVFTNMRFTAGSISVTFAFFALMGFVFLVTQYFQFVRGYSTLGAGIRTVPFAIFTASTAPLSAKLAERIGTKRVVTAGLVSMALGFAVSAVTGVSTSYWVIVLAMLFLGGGLGLIQAPATEAIMGSLPPAKAGVGSAVNDTARELGSTLGVAIVGSVFSSIYASKIGNALAGSPVPQQAIDIAKESVGGAEVVAHQAGQQAGPQAESFVHTAINNSFVDGWHAGSWVCFAVVLVGAVVAWRWLPARDAQSAQDPVALELGDPVDPEVREPALV